MTLEVSSRVKWEFLRSVAVVEDCWIWTGPMKNGYPKYLDWSARKVSHLLFRGPTNRSLRATCGSLRCVNPEHLR
jgi:hypothetical protein